ncbi:MAG: hypothetical protein WEA59_04885 [Ferruginibacter sp.]
MKSLNMNTAFESEKNKKALMYTTIICGVLLLLFFLISWKIIPAAPPVVQDLIEINLGNNDEGFGEEQPLIKGQMAPSEEAVVLPQQPASPQQQEEQVNADDNAAVDAAPVNKPVKTKPTVIKPTTPAPTPAAAPKPQKPKLTYNGPGSSGGNNATEDNGYRSEGNKPGATGDAGDPSGNKDSYGNSAGGKTGGPRVTDGNRKIIRYYSFNSDLPKATIYARIKVSAAGEGTFSRIVKPSTSFDVRYGVQITNYLRSMAFDKASDESIITVQFNFTVQ